MAEEWKRESCSQARYYILLATWITNEFHFSGVAALLKLRPTKAQLLSAHPALRQRWNTFFKANPDKPMSIHNPFAGYVMIAFWPCIFRR